MNEFQDQSSKLPPEQQAIRDKCFHPSGTFIEFKKQEIEQSIPERFEQIVRTYPHRLALKTKTESLTYEALNQMANRVARAIIAVRGQGNEPIALLLDQGVSLIAAILGVLKSGKIFVSLEPFHASARTSYILDDTGTRLIVTSNRSSSEAKDLARTGCQILNVNEIESSLSPENMGLSTAPDALASIMYTSGSTGPPKGVVQNHRNVLHSCKSYTNGFHISKEDRLTLLHSCSFNGSVYNLFGALLNGAALFPLDLREEGVHQLVNWLGQNELTIYHSSPTTFRNALQDPPDRERIPSLRIIHLSGAAVSNVDVELYKKYCPPDCILVHRMGVTETGTIGWYFIDKTAPMEGTRVPIGYPADHKEALILDDSGEEIYDNRAGEIAIRSRYLSLGYWRKPHLTEAKFLPDPEGGDRRTYLTGDLGRMARDGCLLHLGRNDYRVKVRGFSVGVGEIESALLEHRGIQDVVVVGWESRFGDKRLVAYLVLTGLSAPTVTELRDFLKDKLPDYMIPSTFVILSELPLTPNGKVNRTALPAPEDKRPNLATPFAEPRTPIEGELARIWAGILSLDQVGIHDNFFDLGGHSLSGSRLVSQVIRNFQLEIPLQSLFESPTVAEMATVITKQQKRESAAEDGAITATTPSSLRPTPRNTELPLSFAQQRLWFLHQLEPDSPVYNQIKALRLRGRLNRQALQKTLDTIVERHEVLRTTFSCVDDKPTQVIHEPGNVELSAIDLVGIPIERRHGDLDRLLRELTHRPFDLQQDWPLRAALIRWAGEENVLLLVTHHIASDGWSNDILFRELSTLYEAFCEGKGSPLTDLPIQYADYAVWQKEWLQGEVLQRQVSYWKKQLEGVSPLELPTDHPRPTALRHPGRTKTFRFPPILVQGLKKLSRQANTTLFMTLLAAFQSLLHRYTGQDDIVVGSPIAGRTREEVEGLIGFFVNTLVLRNDFSDSPTFLELLGRVKKNALDAYSHQDVPFEKLVEELQPERNLNHNPFFQVIFQLRNYPTPAVSLGQLNIEEYEFGSDIAKFDLSVGLRDDVTGLSGSVEYRTDLFDASTIERMLGHFQTLLEGIVAKPEQPISELPLLTEAEKHQLLVTCNDTKTEYPKDKCIHQLFEEQVEKTPDAIALVFEDQRLTYRELNNRANQLAHYLRKLGVGPEALVGICVERSVEMIVGLLAILKAGGAYVPLDPDYPQERLDFMLEDAQVRVLLTQQQFLSSINHPRVVCLDSDWHKIATQSTDNPQSNISAENLAYVIYTSGSTGKPKGVLIRQGSVVNFLASMAREPGLRETDIFLAVTTLSFDIAGLEIYLPLTVGARVVLARREVAADGVRLAKQLSDCGATVMQATPATWRMLLVGGWQGSRGLKILCGGEALSEDLAQQLTQRCASLWNMYGPTETTIWSAVQRVAADADRVPLGRPIANTQIYILDKYLNPVPIGVPGELHIGGDGLARGYLNRPQLTQEKFIANHFSKLPDSRLYKTGDLARFLPDGNIEFFGRMDNQVKLHGYRIELGEIEAVLAQHPSIKESVVLAREDTPGDQRLVAYVIAAAGSVPSVTDLRSYLQHKLPDYMVPSAFVILDSLPLTPNGKLDRKALPTPDQSRPDLDDSFVAPRTPAEEILANIWAEVLKLDKVGIHDNFFDLGGHSLLATQVVSRIRDALKLDLPLRSLFEAPTIYGLAQRVQGLKEKQDVLRGTKITPVARERYRVQQAK